MCDQSNEQATSHSAKGQGPKKDYVESYRVGYDEKGFKKKDYSEILLFWKRASKKRYMKGKKMTPQDLI